MGEDALAMPHPPDIVNIILQVPAAIPVTNPVDGTTEAIPLLLLLQVPVPPPVTIELAMYVVLVLVQIGLTPETEPTLALGVIVIDC